MRVSHPLCPGHPGRSRGQDTPLSCAKHLPFCTDEGWRQLQLGWVPAALPAFHLLLDGRLCCSGRAQAHGTEVHSLALPCTQPHGSREGKEPRAAFSPSPCACSQSKTQRPHCDSWSHPKLRQLLKCTRDSPTAGCHQPGLSLSRSLSLSQGLQAVPGLHGDLGEL